MRAIKVQATAVHVAFDSITELADYVKARGRESFPGIRANAFDPSKGSAGADMSFDQSVKTGLNGGLWPEGAREMQPVDLPLVDVAHSMPGHPQIVTAEAGYRPNIPAFLAGSPAAMFRTEPATVPNRLLKIGVNLGASASVPPDMLIRRGAAILSVIDTLQAAGYSTELWAVWRITFQDKYHSSIDTLIKDSTDSWSPDSAAFGLASSGFLRCLNWRVLEILAAEHNLTGAKKQVNGTLGHGQDEKGPEFDVWVPGTYGGVANHYKSDTEARAYISGLAAAQLQRRRAA